MDKKTVLAIVLSSIVLLGWQYFFPVPKPHNNIDNVSVADNNSNNSQQVSTNTNLNDIDTTSDDKINAKIVNVETDFLSLHFNQNTGNIRSASILNWKDDDGEEVTFNKNIKQDYLKINTGIDNFFTHYNVETSDITNGKSITFFAESDSYTVRKSYDLHNDSYIVNTTVEIINKTSAPLSIPLSAIIGPNLGDGFEDTSSYDVFEGALISDGSNTEKVKMGKDDSESIPSVKWIAYTSKYFLLAVLNNDVFSNASIMPKDDSPIAKAEGSYIIKPNESVSKSFDLYIGPKYYQELKSVGSNLQKSMDFGWFYFISIPMLYTLNYLYDVFHNYGIAIIILTIIIKLLTLPLTMKSMVSMRAMSALQPQMADLRERYKNDPAKLNQAVMNLYKEHGVNPLSGCLPLILQIPIFFALYKALLLSLELKGAEFFGWIVDLSAKDPYYITPILMGVTMFIQQKMTPTTADPVQQKIFMAMPIILTFLFINFPAGLVIYWLTNNILSIIQQYVINKRNL